MGVARFSFRDLCEQPLAGVDYLKIAHEFHTILLDHVPIMDYARRNEAKRFIILIDTFYDNAVKLVASAKGSKKQVSIGSAKSTVAAGATSKVAVKLNAKGRKLLKKAGKLKVISTVTVKRGSRIPVTAGLKFNLRK